MKSILSNTLRLPLHNSDPKINVPTVQIHPYIIHKDTSKDILTSKVSHVCPHYMVHKIIIIFLRKPIWHFLRGCLHGFFNSTWRIHVLIRCENIMHILLKYVPWLKTRQLKTTIFHMAVDQPKDFTGRQQEKRKYKACLDSYTGLKLYHKQP